MATFSVATTRRSVGANGAAQELTDFVPVVVWNALARVAKDLHLGSPVEIVGRLQTRSYQGNDGTKRYRTEVVATSLEPLTLRTPR